MPDSFPYRLSAHAAKVIAERAIPLAWIARVLDNPEKTVPDRDDPMIRHALARIPEHAGRVLRVVYNETVKSWLIVTAYFDRTQRNRL
jgi:Domain of unknown function (DUF4258)